MKIFLLAGLIFSQVVSGQTFIREFKSITQQLGQAAVDNELQNPTPEGLPGELIETLVPAASGDICEKPQEPKKTHYEVILIANQGIENGGVQSSSKAGRQLKTLELKDLVESVPTTMESFGFKQEAILQRARDIWSSGKITTPSENFDPHSQLGRELFIESLVQASGRSVLNEKELSQKVAGIISSVYKTEDEKSQALQALSIRFYRNYNNARNPGYNNSTNNPFKAELPAADITLNNMLKASAEFDIFQGGVCNDFSEGVAMIGEHLFPDKDVLTINSGTHFGVVVSDGKKHRIIDDGQEYDLSRRLFLDPLFSSTNLRISKVVNGALKEIAVVDTQLGQLTEAAFRTGKKLLKTDADISSLVMQFKKDKMQYAIGEGRLSDSNVFIVVAKYETSGEKWKAHIGIGGSAQRYQNGQDTKYQVHFKTGVERNLFQYLNSQTEVNFTTGLQGSLMKSLNQPAGLNDKIDLSASLDWVNRLEVKSGKANPQGVQVKAAIETENTLGPSNWGNTSGAMSYMEASDTKTMLKNMSFHLNQVNADLELEKKVSNNVTGIASAHYQGSNIGQKASVLAGVTIRAPAGAQILVFTGYTNSAIKGFKTKHSLLATPSGPEVGVKVTTKKGIEVGAGVRGISGKPSVNATLKVPLSNSGR